MSIRSFSFFRRSSDPTFRWRIHTESDQSSRPTRSASERLIGPQSCVLCSYVKSRQAASISNSEQRLTFFVDSFFLDPTVLSRVFLVSLVDLRISPKSSFLPFERNSFLHLLRDPEGLVLPDLSGTFLSPSSDVLKQGGRKSSIQLARGKLKNSLVSNNQDKLARSVLQKQINGSSAFSARSLDLSLDEKLKCLCLISPRGERRGGRKYEDDDEGKDRREKNKNWS